MVADSFSADSSSSSAELPEQLTTSAPPLPPIPDTSHLDGVVYLFGHPIAHSLSPLLHDTIYAALGLRYEQHLYECLSIDECIARTRDAKFFGASVTMPHKVAIIRYIDVLTPEAKAIGAVNTIFLRRAPSGKRLLCGTNTDCIGIREAIRQNAPQAALWGRPALIIGGGGTCRAAVYALKHYLACSEIYIVNRDPAEVAQVIAECRLQGFGDGLRYIPSVPAAEALLRGAAAAPPALVVSAIPDSAPVSSAELQTRAIVSTILAHDGLKGPLLEMCYHPSSNTAISRLGRAHGWQIIEGIEAMIWQGLEQDKVWLQRQVSTLPVAEVRKAIYNKLGRSRL